MVTHQKCKSDVLSSPLSTKFYPHFIFFLLPPPYSSHFQAKIKENADASFLQYSLRLENAFWPCGWRRCKFESSCNPQRLSLHLLYNNPCTAALSQLSLKSCTPTIKMSIISLVLSLPCGVICKSTHLATSPNCSSNPRTDEMLNIP